MYIEFGMGDHTQKAANLEFEMATRVATASEFTSPGELKKLLLELLPNQGNWTEEEYLWLTDHTNRYVEFTDGYIEVLPMPTDNHQAILKFLFLAFHFYMDPRGGCVHFSPLRLRIREGKFREPDLILLRAAKDARRENRFWLGADLTLEVVSNDKPERDIVDKRHDYAEGGVPEYWIVNPFSETITVLRLQGKKKKYVEHGVFGRGARATSSLLAEFSVSVDEVMDVV
jgi:Uma2 family endonuclease